MSDYDTWLLDVHFQGRKRYKGYTREQIIRRAAARGLTIEGYFTFESHKAAS